MAAKEKHTFDIVSKQQPLYSGTNVSVLGGNLVMACGKAVNVVDPATGVLKCSFDAPIEDDLILHVAAAPAINRVAISTKSLQIYLLSLSADGTKLTEVRSWVAAQVAVGCLAFSPSGQFLASGSTDGSVRVWDAQNHYLTHNMVNKGGIVTHISFEPSNTDFIAVGTVEGFLHIWDVETKKKVHEERVHSAGVEFVAWLSSGHIVSVGKNKALVAISTKDWAATKTVVVPDQICAAAQVSDNELVIGSFDGGLVRVGIAANAITIEKRKKGKTDDAEENMIVSLGMVGDSLFSSNAANDVAFLEPKTLKKQRVLVGFLDQIYGVAPLPGDRIVVASNSTEARVFCEGTTMYDAALIGHTDMLLGVQTSSDGAFIATSSKDRTIRVWSAETFECVGVCEGHSGEVAALALNPKMHESSIFQCVSSSADELKVWDLVPCRKHTPGSAVVQLNMVAGVVGAHDGLIHSVAFSPNDQMIASAGKDRNVNVWTVNKKKLVRAASMKGHRRAINSVVFSPVDRVVASAANDGAIRLWSLVTFTCIKTMEMDKKPILQAAFISQGLQLACTTADGLVRVWSAQTNKCVCAMELHEDKVWSLVVKDDGATLITAGADATICVLRDCTAEFEEQEREEVRERIQGEQNLRNALLNKDYSAAFRLALTLDHPRHLRKVVAQWMLEADCEVKMANVISSLEEDKLRRLLEVTRDWMTNARQCREASMTLSSVFGAFHYTYLAKLKDFSDVLEPLVSYASRHLNRMHTALQGLSFVEYVSVSMSPLNYPALSVSESVLGQGGALKMLQANGIEIVEDVTKDTAAASPATNGNKSKTPKTKAQSPKAKAKVKAAATPVSKKKARNTPAVEPSDATSAKKRRTAKA